MKQIIEELFISLLQRYQNGLEEKIRGNEFVYDSGRSYIDSQKWLKDQKATINPKNNDGNCFEYAITVALNYQNINNHP